MPARICVFACKYLCGGAGWLSLSRRLTAVICFEIHSILFTSGSLTVVAVTAVDIHAAAVAAPADGYSTFGWYFRLFSSLHFSSLLC